MVPDSHDRPHGLYGSDATLSYTTGPWVLLIWPNKLEDISWAKTMPLLLIQLAVGGPRTSGRCMEKRALSRHRCTERQGACECI